MRLNNYFKEWRKINILLLALVLIMAMSGCACQHEWTNWTKGTDKMERTCTLCQETETTEINHEVLAAQYIVGEWFAFAYKDKNDAFQLDQSTAVANFYSDGTYRLEILGEVQTGVWESQVYDAEGEMAGGNMADYLYLLDYDGEGAKVFFSGESTLPENLPESLKDVKLITYFLGGENQAELTFGNFITSN